MDDYLGFRRLAGLRHIAFFRGQWSGRGLQSAATGGWKPEQQWLDLIANNTRLLAAPGTFPNLALFFLATRWLADDWACGHQVVVAETFCDPERFAGTRRRAGVPGGLPAPTGAAPMFAAR